MFGSDIYPYNQITKIERDYNGDDPGVSGFVITCRRKKLSISSLLTGSGELLSILEERCKNVRVVDL